MTKQFPSCGTANNGVVDWLEFNDPASDMRFSVNLTFLMSNWECIYGRGCPGHFGVTDRYVIPDIGCCSDGFYTQGPDDLQAVEDAVKRLTPADWDQRNREYVEKMGSWGVSRMGGDQMKSRVFEGGCVFANRSGGSTGKPGCAFLAYASRHGEEVSDAKVHGHESHTTFMPQICHEAPVRFDLDDDDEPTHMTITAWDADRWFVEDPPESNDDWMMWWCVDKPEAYIAETPVYVRMKDTLINRMGQAAYDEMARLIEVKQPKVDPMPGAVLNEGRPLLPLMIGGRKPKRDDDGNFDRYFNKMKERT